ncbi:hypothetical protein A2U01_0065611, partial [Trifolium medium]|nr:hypothetical protein [Trifolium medium]
SPPVAGRNLANKVQKVPGLLARTGEMKENHLAWREKCRLATSSAQTQAQLRILASPGPNPAPYTN